MLEQEKPKSPFEAGIGLYNTPKPENDPDLISQVRQVLLEKGIPEETIAATYDVNRHITSAKDRISVVQRTQLNRFFELALMTTPENTTTIRSDLLPNGKMSDWMEHVTNTVVPFISHRKLLGK